MKSKDIKELREKLWLKNNKKCPLLKTEVTQDKVVLDHIHKNKDEAISKDKGTVRNSIETRANMMEGKITNFWKRLYGSDENLYPISLPDFLRNLADYLEEGAYEENGKYYVHPNEVQRPKKVSKRNYNKLKKLYNEEEFVPKRKGQKKKPMLEYPKSGKLTIGLRELFNRFNISPYN